MNSLSLIESTLMLSENLYEIFASSRKLQWSMSTQCTQVLLPEDGNKREELDINCINS